MSNKKLLIKFEQPLIHTNDGNNYNLPEGEEYNSPAILREDEYPYIYKGHENITDKEFNDALDVIITHAMKLQLHTIRVDLDIKSKINEERTKPLEISLQELSAMFDGREIIIVNDKELGDDNGERREN